MSDGKIIISTEVDTSGIDKGINYIKVKALTGLKTFGRILGSFVKTVLASSLIIGGAIGGIFGATGLAYGFKKAIEDSETLRGNLQYLVAMVQVAVKNLADRMMPAILNIMNAIVNAIYTALVYINAITKAWFKFDLFAGVSDQFASNMSSAEKSSKAIKNNLQQAPFDEMNVLNENSSSGGGAGGASSAGIPSFPSMDDIPIPSWLQWIIDHKDEVVSAISAIALALIAMKVLGIDPISALGIGLFLDGLVRTLNSIIDFLNDPTFENFTDILIGIAEMVLGVGLAFGLWPVAVAGAVALIILIIVKHFDEIMGLFNKLEDWLDKNVLGWLEEHFGKVGDFIYLPIKGAIEFAKGIFESFYGGIRNIINGIMRIFQGDFFGGIKQIFGGLLSVMTAPLQGFLKAVVEVVKFSFEKFHEIGEKVGDIIGSAFKAVINGVLYAIENILNTPIRAIDALLDVINAVPGINIGYLQPFDLPRLAKGGIINNPGSGVPLGIGGEKGAEWVQPLTDEQSLELVADKIGKKITIELTNITEINGRQINRTMKKIDGENNFAYNR